MGQARWELKEHELVPGLKVIIRSSRYSMTNCNIIGEVTKLPDHFTRILVKFFDPNEGEEGAYVIKEFSITMLEKALPDECIKLAQHHKRIALEFNELYKQLTKK